MGNGVQGYCGGIDMKTIDEELMYNEVEVVKTVEELEKEYWYAYDIACVTSRAAREAYSRWQDALKGKA